MKDTGSCWFASLLPANRISQDMSMCVNGKKSSYIYQTDAIFHLVIDESIQLSDEMKER